MDGGGSCSGGYFKLYEELELQEFQDPSRLRMKDSPSIAATASLSRSTAILLLRLQVLLKPRRYTEWRERSDCLQAYFMALLNTVQSTPGLYLSYETDITLNFQRRCKLVEGWMAKPIWKQADPRFVWNRNSRVHLVIEVA
ncbi:hypothetical protein TB1_032271 [Malus domestica]